MHLKRDAGDAPRLVARAAGARDGPGVDALRAVLREQPLEPRVAREVRETSILLPNNQRHHRTSHAPKDVLTLHTRGYQMLHFVQDTSGVQTPNSNPNNRGKHRHTPAAHGPCARPLTIRPHGSSC